MSTPGGAKWSASFSGHITLCQRMPHTYCIRGYVVTRDAVDVVRNIGRTPAGKRTPVPGFVANLQETPKHRLAEF